MGICFGHQILANALAGLVGFYESGEFGIAQIHQQNPSKLTAGLPQQFHGFVSHYQSVITLPAGSEVIASNSIEKHHIIQYADWIYGLQFHPESLIGKLQNFIKIKTSKTVLRAIFKSARK